MISTDFSVPAVVLVSAAAIGVVAYAIAPTIGERLIHKSGAIAVCERALISSAEREAQRAEAELPSSDIDVGGVLGGLFGGFQGGEEFARHYGPQLNRMSEGVLAPLRDQATKKRDLIRQKLALQAEAGESICRCRARVAVNSGHTALAVFTATGGMISWAPVNDWHSAMSASDVASQCSGVPS